MADNENTSEPVTPAAPAPAAASSASGAGEGLTGVAVTPPPRRSPGHRGADVKDTVAEMAAKAHEISLEAGSKMAAAMKDVINAAAGLTGFVIESARDLLQYMVRRGQMTQEEADKLIREVELAMPKRQPPSAASRETATVHRPASAGLPAKAAAPRRAAPPAAAQRSKTPAKVAARKPAAKKASPAKVGSAKAGSAKSPKSKAPAAKSAARKPVAKKPSKTSAAKRPAPAKGSGKATKKAKRR
jgi:hypothetical protein